MTRQVLGIDIAKATMDVALKSDGRLAHASFTNDQLGFARLSNWLTRRKAGQVAVCLEATGRYGNDVALFLHEAGHRVSVVNPARIKAYGASKLQRNKTDKQDAALIADFGLSQRPAAWSPPLPEQIELQALVRRRRALKHMRHQEVNRLKSGEPSQFVRTQIQDQIALLDKQLQELEQQLEEHIQQHDNLKERSDLMVTIPGVGRLTAACLLGEIPDIMAFKSAKQLAAYAGLTPRHVRSGSSILKRTAISKTGNANIRAALYWPAISASRHNPAVSSLRERLQAKGKNNMVIIVAAMRKLLHIVFGVIKSGRPFDPRHEAKMQTTP